MKVYMSLVTVLSFSFCANSLDKSAVAQIRECEQDALRVGTLLADDFNAPTGEEDTDARLHQDYLTEHLGFAPWMAGGTWKSGGKTLYSKTDARELQKKGGWLDHSLKESSYSPLRGKWIYFFGDSTLRQIWTSYAAPFQDNHFERNAKEWTRHYCAPQTNGGKRKTKHVKGGDYPDEGWMGPCGVNEVTCHVSGYDDNGLLTYDWKHFPYEDYDEWMWGKGGPWGAENKEDRRPDILVLAGMGLHTCWHAHPEVNQLMVVNNGNNGMSKLALERNGTLANPSVNETIIQQHAAMLPKLMRDVRASVAARTLNSSDSSNKKHTTVIVQTVGMTFIPRVDICINQFNRLVTNEAHKLGFPVLDRGEIERRLMYKSIGHPKPSLPAQVHLEQPGPAISSTALLTMISCLDKHSIDSIAVNVN